MCFTTLFLQYQVLCVYEIGQFVTLCNNTYQVAFSCHRYMIRMSSLVNNKLIPFMHSEQQVRLPTNKILQTHVSRLLSIVAFSDLILLLMSCGMLLKIPIF